MVDPDTGRYLLEAALLKDSRAIESFEKWQELIEFDDINSDSYCILPAVYKNLLSHGATGSSLNNIKGISRRIWIENQTRIPTLQSVFESFNRNRIEYLLMVNFFEIFKSYEDEAVFPLDGVEILVDPRQADAVVKLLSNLGWMEVQTRAFGLDFSVFKSKNLASLTISWRRGRFEKFAFDSAVDSELRDLNVNALAAPAQILYWCKENNGKRVRSVRQSFLIYSALKANPEFDWNALVLIANACGLSNNALHVLENCAETTEMEIPADVTGKLAQNGESEPQNRIRNIISAYRSLRKAHLREIPFEANRTTASDFAGFLCKQWNVPTIFALPWEIVKRLIYSQTEPTSTRLLRR